MQMMMKVDTGVGTIGGTMLAVIANLGADVMHTAVTAATGAVVSFVVSVGMQYVIRKLREWRRG